MKYLTSFDSNGRRETSYPVDDTMTKERYDELIAQGFSLIDEADWNYYVGNMGSGDNGTGYIRDPGTGKPVSAPAYVPSKEEKLAQLDAQYNADKADLLTAYQTAMLYGDTDTMDSLKADLTALDNQYDEDYERIVGGE